uniref:non-specific protein-tyrosine kinase n=1 Tax=Callorhinchus milii TaxID=7868 RepID=A0A4W3GXC7_CALMI
MSPEEGSEWLRHFLQELQLEQFHLKIRNELNVTRLSHFDYVKTMDLERIGMGRPGRNWEDIFGPTATTNLHV